MSKENHYKKLENVFKAAPINNIIPDLGISIHEGVCEIIWVVDKTYFHAGKSLHGALYFKLLDDAAYFACASLETNVFLLTKSFHIQLLRPITGGIIKAIGKIEISESNEIIASSKLYSPENKVLASGEGVFAKSKLLLTGLQKYAL